METVETIIKALRCLSATKANCDHSCQYFQMESDEDIEKFCAKFGAERGDYPNDFWGGCDTERIAEDAANALEAMTGKICPVAYPERTAPCLREGCAAWGVIGWEPAEASREKDKEIMGCKLCGREAMQFNAWEPFGGGVA